MWCLHTCGGGKVWADQLHVAYSGTIKGTGIFAGGPYHCAQGSLTTAARRSRPS
jgi:hypothetical protein